MYKLEKHLLKPLTEDHRYFCYSLLLGFKWYENDFFITLIEDFLLMEGYITAIDRKYIRDIRKVSLREDLFLFYKFLDKYNNIEWEDK